MFWSVQTNPSETFQEMLWRMKMTEEEYYEYLEELEKTIIEAWASI